MIKDNIKNIDQYNKVIDQNIIEALKELAAGRNAQQVDYSVFEYVYEGTESKIVFENHERNIDYQFIKEGNEYIYLADKNMSRPLESYNSKADYQLFYTDCFSRIIMNEGDFLVLMPGEIHSPKHQYRAQKVKRIVIKKKI